MVQTFSLRQITQIKFYFLLTSAVLYAEVEPLDVPLGIGVDSKEEVEFILLDLDDAVKIPTFEYTVKDELSFEIEGWVHSFECAIEYGWFVESIHSKFLLYEVRLDDPAVVNAITFDWGSSL